eukprot:GEMP01013361.1.p1 GENE.GEMP01013361.1~~GEMP01013361.1.p1  ORF type:complete len:684 (+),score=217.54 GEMP01013361.1:36-2054(+)
MKTIIFTIVTFVASTSPISKVLELLETLEARVKYDGEKEQKQYAEYADWCDNESRDKRYAIEQGQAQSDELQATIEKASADVSTQSARVNDVTKVISSNEGDLTAAHQIREAEHKDFLAEETELVDTVDTLIRAQSVLSKHLSGSLLQSIPKVMDKLRPALTALLNAAIFSTQDTRQLKAFMQAQSGDDDDSGPGFMNPTAKAYEGHSGSLLDTLSNMQEKAEGMLAEARRTEMNAKHNFELLAQSLDQEIKVDAKTLSTDKKIMAEAQQIKANAEGDIAVTDKGLAEDRKYLQDLEVNCKQRASDEELSQKSRSEELHAIAEAKRIISESTGGATTRQYTLVQVKASTGTPAEVYDKVADRIKHLGREHNNYQMTQLASQIRTVESMSADPFTKVKDLIQNMITRLIVEAAEEADHKAFCDKEIAASSAKRDEHQASVDKLSIRVEKNTALINKLKEEVALLRNELSELSASEGKLIKMRQGEHEEFVKARGDFKQGLEGVRRAVALLRDYYNKAALLQQPEVGVHGKATQDSGGIIGLLEVVETDFGRSLAEAEAEEDQAVNTYEKTMQDIKVSKATKTQEAEYKEQESARVANVLAEAQNDRSGVQVELDAVMEYLGKLRPQCTTQPVSYEERKQRREQEITGLKDALEILENETAGTSFLAVRVIKRH